MERMSEELAGKECMACGMSNDRSAKVCEHCGTEFEDVVLETPAVIFTELISGERIEIPTEGAVIGRSGGIGANVFHHKWVSDPHCRITIDGGECFIEDIGGDGCGSTNGTFLNGERLPPRLITKCKNKDTVKVAHIMLDVGITYPERDSGTEPEAPAEDEAEVKWVMECPVCGTRYDVESGTVRMAQCGVCTDAFDKKKMAKVKPRQVRL